MKNITKIIKIARPLYGIVASIAVLILITATLQQVSPILSKYIIDEIVSQVQDGEGNIEKLFLLIGISFTVNTITSILSSYSDRKGDHFSGEFRKFLTEKFYSKVFTLPQKYFDSELSGKIVHQLNRGIDTIKGFANTSTNFILPTFLQSAFTLIVLAYYNLPTAIFTFILFPIYFVLTLYSTKKWGKEEVKKNKYEDITRGRIQEVISNIKVVKSFTNERNEHEFIVSQQKSVNKHYAKQSKAFHIYDFLRKLSLELVLLLINITIFYSTYKENLSIGEMVLIIQLVTQARRPLFALSFILTQVQQAESGSKEFFEILELDSVENYEQEEENITKVKNPTIEFKNLKFNYDDDKEVLKDMSFVIKPNEKIALVGPSGAGKTTIINLILKFYEPESGNILINGNSYKDLSHKFIRNNISLVFQENELFSTTVGENVSYGNKATEEEIIEALKKANAYEFVMKLKKGLNTEVGERGIKLSGGQKQRLQIARAILNDSPILILDEATSSLDSRSEREVQEAMKILMRDKLVIIIAHRLSTIQNVDRIFVIDEGKLVDQGTPQELAKRGGIYSDLLRYQVEGNEKLLKNYEIY